MKKQCILIGLVFIITTPVSRAGKPGEDIKTEKKTEQKAQEDLTKKTTEQEKREEQQKIAKEAEKQHLQPEVSPVKSAINALDTMLKELAQEKTLGLEEKDILESIKTYEDAYKTYEQSVKSSEPSIQRQKERLEQFEITFNATIGTYTIPERITLLRNLAAHFGTSTQQGSGLKDTPLIKTLIKSVLDSFSTVEHSQANPQATTLNIAKAFEDKKINETLRQAAAGLALSEDKTLAAATTDFAKKLAGWVNADAAHTQNIANALLSWIRIVVSKDKISEVLSTVDFSKMAAANDPKMYEDWILLLRDLLNLKIPGIIAANIFTHYLNTTIKTGTPNDYVSALEFLEKNIEAQRLASFFKAFKDLQESFKKQLESLIADKRAFSNMRLIKALEKLASPETLMTIKLKLITDSRRISKESLRTLPREELYFIVTMLADLDKGAMKIDDITYGILSNVEAALNDVTSELEAFKKNKKFPKGFDNLSKEARQMFYDESLTSAEKQKLGELQKQNNNLSATKEELINLITPWNFSFQKWEWVRKIFPKKVTFTYKPSFMQWNNDRISKELFNGVKGALSRSATDIFIPSFDAFFKKWAYFSSADPQFASIQQWLMQQASERFNDFLITSHTDPKITAHLLKNHEMQECFYHLEAQRGMGASWLSYFVQQALPKKENMRNISFPLFKIYIDNWFKDDRRPMTLNMALDYANTMTDQQFDYILKQIPADSTMLNRMANLQLPNELEKINSSERKKTILETLIAISNQLLQKEPRWATSTNQMIQLFKNELSKIKPAA